jgi:hypothetical protein
MSSGSFRKGSLASGGAGRCDPYGTKSKCDRGSLFASCFSRDRSGAAARSRPIIDFENLLDVLDFRDVRFKAFEKR